MAAKLDQIQSDLKNAQLARDEMRISTLRLLLSEIHNTQIQKGTDLSDQDVTAVLQREAKKRREAAVGFRSGGREESAQKEEAELKVLQIYLPAEMDSEELTKIVESTITEMGATSMADMGKVMSAVMGKVAGRADGTQVSTIVKEKLS
ncbi:GatB/YqeY domain-containing protein [Patescibacteria group bacterium]|nr:GatB/YqeY domain-containing protein [Patescibacteria group bacterium]